MKMKCIKQKVAVLTLSSMLFSAAPLCAWADGVPESDKDTAVVTEQTENSSFDSAVQSNETASAEDEQQPKDAEQPAEGSPSSDVSALALKNNTAKAGSEAIEVIIALDGVEKATEDDLANLLVWAERVNNQKSGFDQVELTINDEGQIIATVTSNIMGQVTIKAAKGTDLETVLQDEKALIGSVQAIFSGTATMYIGEKSFVYNDETIPLDVAPFIQNNRTLVPIRALSEACGATVVYAPSMETISISLGNDVIKMQLGAANMEKNGQTLSNDAVAQVTAEGRAVLPFRAIAEALGFNVEALENEDHSIKAVTFTNL